MGFKVMADNNQEISAKQDGALYNVALNDTDLIIESLGDEFALSRSGLIVTVGTGEAIIHGRHVTAYEENQITLPTNQSGYIVLRIDLSQQIGQEAMLYATPSLTHQEINWGGVIYDMPIATFSTSSTQITSLIDERKVRGSVPRDITFDTLAIGQTNITLYNERINQNSVLSFYTSKFGVNPTNAVVENGSVTLTFDAQDSNIVVGVKIDGTI